MKKKLVFLLLACLMLCAAVSGAMAEIITDEYGIVYRVNADYSDVYSYQDNPTDVIIQSVIGGKPVTHIGAGAFENCTSLQSIAIPNSVTHIGVAAFANCTSLQSITLPNSITNIGMSAFENCTSLQSITIPDSVTDIATWAFGFCANLKNITFEGSTPPAISGDWLDVAGVETISVPLGSKTAYKNAVGKLHIDKVVEYVPVVQASPSDAFNIRLITTEFRADEHKALEIGATQKAAEVLGVPASTVRMDLKDWNLQVQHADDGEDSKWFAVGGDDLSFEEFMGESGNLISLSVSLPATAKGKNVAVIHQVNGTWKFENSSVVNGKIAVSVSSLSPVAIVWAEEEVVNVDLPKTGDESSVILWSALACISLLSMTMLVRKKKEA